MGDAAYGAGPNGVTARDLVPQRAAEWGRSVTAWIVEHPELSLGLALAVGVGIGLMVKRR